MTVALCSLFGIVGDSYAAPRAAIRGSAGTRQPVAKTAKVETSEKEAEKETKTTVAEPKPVSVTEAAVNKASQFDEVLSSSSSSSASKDNEVAERIKQQRAAAAARDAAEDLAAKASAATKGGRNACDFGLRECMTKTCGKDFTKCATDGDTDLGIKFNACRRNLTCTGEEFKLFTTEIKADRDMNVQLSSYNAVVDCGNEYSRCLLDECGETFDKCLGKAASVKATNKCKNIATKCKEQDSGLASRFGTVMGKLREHAEVDVQKDEERMYKLRDLMRGACEKLGAAFDERSFDCVYTVSFFAGKEQKIPMSSRKRYAGDTFVCNQEWFGIDVTTFKENAYRETRAQTAASSAMLGSGVGMTAGLIASGAMDRALDRQKAEKELKKAEEEKKAAEEAEGKTDDKKTADSTADKDKKKEGENQEEKKEEAAAEKTGTEPKTEPKIEVRETVQCVGDCEAANKVAEEGAAAVRSGEVNPEKHSEAAFKELGG